MPITVTIDPSKLPIQALAAGPVTDAVRVEAAGESKDVPLAVSDRLRMRKVR